MKIFCIGRNYADHAKELNNDVPDEPVVFMKPPTALLKGNRDFYHPEFSENIHHELELVLRIAKNGKHISRKFASNYYEQLTVGIDFTARDIQAKLKEKKHPWEIAKGFDGSAVLGEWRSIKDFDTNNINFSLSKNDELVQQGNSKDMLFDFDVIIEYVSQFFTLQQGDLIYTGTPAGVSKVSIGDSLKGYLNNEMLFRCSIK